jgi:hypothetical protein
MRGKRGIRERLTYANVMVTILAVLVVGGGGAYAAKKLKLKNNSVTTAKIRDGAVTDPKLAASVGDRSVGRTVAETTGVCTVTPGGDVCSFVTLQLPRPARVLVVADARAAASAGNASGACQLLADNAGITLGSQFGNVDGVGDFFALNGVSGVLPAGQHNFSLFCTQSVGSFVVTDRHISAVSLSAE